MKTIILILTTFAFLYYGIVWDTGRLIVQPAGGQVCSEEIKRTIKWFGDKKNYRIMPDGTLQVEVNGKYLKLKIKTK